MKTVEYTLPAFWASALINADESGMTDEDIEAMITWLEKEQPGYCVGCSEEEGDFRKYHDAFPDVLACNCLTYTFVPVED